MNNNEESDNARRVQLNAPEWSPRINQVMLTPTIIDLQSRGWETRVIPGAQHIFTGETVPKPIRTRIRNDQYAEGRQRTPPTTWRKGDIGRHIRSPHPTDWFFFRVEQESPMAYYEENSILVTPLGENLDQHPDFEQGDVLLLCQYSSINFSQYGWTKGSQMVQRLIFRLQDTTRPMDWSGYFGLDKQNKIQMQKLAHIISFKTPGQGEALLKRNRLMIFKYMVRLNNIGISKILMRMSSGTPIVSSSFLNSLPVESFGTLLDNHPKPFFHTGGYFRGRHVSGAKPGPRVPLIMDERFRTITSSICDKWLMTASLPHAFHGIYCHTSILYNVNPPIRGVNENRGIYVDPPTIQTLVTMSQNAVDIYTMALDLQHRMATMEADFHMPEFERRRRQLRDETFAANEEHNNGEETPAVLEQYLSATGWEPTIRSLLRDQGLITHVRVSSTTQNDTLPATIPVPEETVPLPSTAGSSSKRSSSKRKRRA